MAGSLDPQFLMVSGVFRGHEAGRQI